MRIAQAGLVPVFAHHLQPFVEHLGRLERRRGALDPGIAADPAPAPNEA
jgi:hypothetical protein